MINEIALKKFAKAHDASEATVDGALSTCLADITKFGYTSVAILAIDEQGAQHMYMAGPRMSSLRAVWLSLQEASMDVLREFLHYE